jgi:hypothetical protein
MNAMELRGIIEADSVCLECMNRGDDEGCAQRLNQILPKEVFSLHLTSRGVLAAFDNPADGELVMQSLEQAAISNPLVKRALGWMSPANGGRDVGSTSTRFMLDSLAAAGILTTGQVSVIKSQAEKVPSITNMDVARAFGRGL